MWHEWKILVFALLLFFQPIWSTTNTSSCAALSSCTPCVDAVGCNWCNSNSECTVENDVNCEGFEAGDCSNGLDYIVIVFIVILAVLICLCFGTCYWRKYQSGSHGMSTPLLPQQTRNFLWRNSLQEQGYFLKDAYYLFILILGFLHK